jgi:putative DNA primase/helicase
MSDLETFVDDELVPLGDALAGMEKERSRLERRAKSAAARSVAARGGVASIIVNGGSTSWRDLLLYDKEGRVRSTPGNVLRVLEGDEEFTGSLVKDTFRAKWVWQKKPPGEIDGPFPREMADSDVSYVGMWMETAHGVVPGLTTLGAQLGAYAARHSVDALRAHCESLVWDGKPRLNSWLSACLGVEDTPYTAAVGRRWLISGAARALAPGIKADCMLILEGAQGKLKSTALQVLGGPWHTDSLPTRIDDKDAVMALGGKWIVEWGEFDRFGRADQSTIKDFVSKKTDAIRPPYGRMVEEWPRRCIFAGTTNEDTYLLDATGGRRFWPVRVGDVRMDRLRRFRDQLWAEAVVAFKAFCGANGDEKHPEYVRNQWWLTREEQALQVDQVDERYMVDPWEDKLAAWAETQPFITTAEALKQLGLDAAKATQHDNRRLGKVFRRLGFSERRQSRAGTGRLAPREWRYYPGVTDGVTGVTKEDLELVTQKPSEITGVTGVTGVTKGFPRTQVRARAHDETMCDTGDTGDTSETSGEMCHQRASGFGDTASKSGDTPVQLTIAELWDNEVLRERP